MSADSPNGPAAVDDAGLQAVVAAWPTLPLAIRAAVVALVNASTPSG